MNFYINDNIVKKSNEEFENFSNQRIEGLKLTLDNEQIKLYNEAKEKGLELLNKQKGL